MLEIGIMKYDVIYIIMCSAAIHFFMITHGKAKHFHRQPSAILHHCWRLSLKNWAICRNKWLRVLPP